MIVYIYSKPSTILDIIENGMKKSFYNGGPNTLTEKANTTRLSN